MSTHPGHETTNPLPSELVEILSRTGATAEAQATLSAATPDLDRDPEFVAGYLRAQFVEDVYRAMAVQHLNKNSLAHKLGKSRQYVGRLLNESANFTLSTVAEIACAMGWQISVRMFAPDERLSVIRSVTQKAKKAKISH